MCRDFFENFGCYRLFWAKDFCFFSRMAKDHSSGDFSEPKGLGLYCILLGYPRFF